MKLEFKPEDFRIDVIHEGCVCTATEAEIAAQANARLAEMIKDAPMVYREATDNGPGYPWYEQPGKGDTHTALLVNIGEVEK